jgi:hypothetical protein
MLVIVVGVLASGIIGLVVDRSSHSVSDTLEGAALPVLLVWVAVIATVVALRRRAD